MRALHSVLAAGSVAVVAAACGLDSSGLGESGSGFTDAGPPSDGALVIDGGGQTDVASGPETGQGSDGSGADDSGSGGGDGCPTVEICDNGVDDTCDGLIDCADPACQSGWTCTPSAVPPGWALVEYAEMSQPDCSVGYAAPSDALEGPDGKPATCACACDVAGIGSCESGDFTVTPNVATPTCTGLPVTSPASGGACSPAAAKYTAHAGGMLQVAPVPYTPGSCTPAPSGTPPPVEYAGEGRICTATQTGAGCPSGGVCAPAPGSAFDLCIVASGAQPCPSGFTNAHSVGSGVTDDRGCTPCTCGGATAQCANASLTLFTASDCSMGAQSLPAANTCVAFPSMTMGGGGNGTFVAYEYSAVVQGESCPPSAVSAKGGVSLAGIQTVCCRP